MSGARTLASRRWSWLVQWFMRYGWGVLLGGAVLLPASYSLAWGLLAFGVVVGIWLEVAFFALLWCIEWVSARLEGRRLPLVVVPAHRACHHRHCRTNGSLQEEVAA